LKAVVALNDAHALSGLSRVVSGERGGRGEIVLDVNLGEAGRATVLLGRDFALDGELAERIREVDGVMNVALEAIDAPRLALVS
jgi:DNA polymerase III subunit alpha